MINPIRIERRVLWKQCCKRLKLLNNSLCWHTQHSFSLSLNTTLEHTQLEVLLSTCQQSPLAQCWKIHFIRLLEMHTQRFPHLVLFGKLFGPSPETCLCQFAMRRHCLTTFCPTCTCTQHPAPSSDSRCLQRSARTSSTTDTNICQVHPGWG